MIRQLIFRNAIHRPLRTFISVVAVAVEVTLVLVIVGLSSGLLEEVGKRIQGVGADIMLQPPSSQIILAFSGAPMTIKLREPIETMKYVQAVAPVLTQFNSSGGIDIIYGIEPASFRAVSGGFVFLQGHDMVDPDDMLADDLAAKGKHLQVGQTYRLFDHDFHVAGIVEHGKGARIFLSLKTLQDISGARDKASLFFIKCTRPEHTPAVMEQMHSIFQGYEIRALKDFLSQMTSANIPGLDIFITTMISLAVAIGFLVIFLSMYTTVIERTREIGVLKSIGASKGYIVKALLSEASLICDVGVLAGIALSYTVSSFLVLKFPTLAIHIPPDWIPRAAAIALIGGLIGAAYPAWLATKKDPVEALFYD
ncbi:MAG TPA: FtsX-like permease family protein [Candidatus Acidoferrum sp.]|nr:FtsX-like permease family protein [Candidatus Acidoferrum sp.]